MGKKGKEKRDKKEDRDEDDHPPEQAEKQEVHPEEEVKEQAKVEIIAPKKVQYCPICTLPFELCRYGKLAKECRKFLQQNAPTKVAKYHPEATGDQKQEAIIKQEATVEVVKKDKTAKDKFIVIDVKQRMKKKFITTISGLQIFKIESKQLTKKLSKKFACSSSAIDENTVQIQGDFLEEVREILINEYKVKKKYILEKEEFKEIVTAEKDKKKADKQLEENTIPEDPQEDNEANDGEKPAKFKTQFQEALADLSDHSEGQKQ